MGFSHSQTHTRRADADGVPTVHAMVVTRERAPFRTQVAPGLHVGCERLTGRPSVCLNTPLAWVVATGDETGPSDQRRAARMGMQESLALPCLPGERRRLSQPHAPLRVGWRPWMGWLQQAAQHENNSVCRQLIVQPGVTNRACDSTHAGDSNRCIRPSQPKPTQASLPGSPPHTA